MPIYEYVCEACNEAVEVIQKIADQPLTECPKCNADAMKKQTSMSSFQLKGGGWYKDGYSGGGKSPSGQKAS